MAQRKRYSQARIIAALKEHEARSKVAGICRKLGIAKNTFYGWRAQFGGMELSEAKWLKELELENGKLRRLLADALLDNAAFNGSVGWRAVD